MRLKRKRSIYVAALLALVGALVIAGCGGGGSSSSSSGSSGEGTSLKASDSGSVEGTIGTASIDGLGTVLVDSEGMTVYEYTPDSGSTSNCYGSCAAEWPPVIAEGKPTAGEGAMASDLGTTKRKDGTMQVTYKGHPLYTFVEDSAPGEVTGNELEGTWFVLNASGAAVEGQPTGGGAESETESMAEEEESASSGGAHGY